METTPPSLDDLSGIDTWVFDLDNTLYPAACDLFTQIDQKMGEFIMNLFDIGHGQAKTLQKSYFHAHGTTLRGLMLEHELDPAPYLAYVHDIDLSGIEADGDLNACLSALPGRKLIYTNADHPHAERVLDQLGIAHHFEAIYDVVASDYLPKPAMSPYVQFVDLYKVDPKRTLMAEDSAHNLEPAAELGMQTLLVEGRGGWPEGVKEMDYVHHRSTLLTPWLQALINA